MGTTTRVSEEEAEAASLVLSTLADNRYKHARAVLLALIAERAALEARLAEARKEFAMEVRERMHRARRDAYQGPDLSAIAEFTNWLRAEAEGKG